MRGEGFHSHASTLYHRFSHVYERVFTRVFGPGIQSTIESLNIPPGAKVLEVGVGTGLSLESYPRHAEVTAIDIAGEMLARARQKVIESGWQHIALKQMDALDLDFPDGQFDYVLAFHVASVVSDPRCLIREMCRVGKAGGTVVVINHFRTEQRWLAPWVVLLDPVTRRLGWRTTLRLSDLVDHAPLRLEQCYKTSARSLFTVVVAAKPQSSLAEIAS